MASSKEDALVLQLDALANDDREALHVWYKAAYAHLRACDHWWCQHTKVMYGLAKVLSYETQPVVVLIWNELLRQLSQCKLCINQHHRAQGLYASALEKNQVLLGVMTRKDAERVAGWLEAGKRELERQQQQLEEGHEAQQQAQDTDVNRKFSLAIIEALSYPTLLLDAEVMTSLTAVLVMDCWDRSMVDELVSIGTKPGLYLLAGHPDMAVRELVVAVIKKLTPLSSWEDAEQANLDTLLAQWVPLIRKAEWSPPDAAVTCAAGPSGRPLVKLPLESLLSGLNMLLQGLKPPLMAATVEAFPDLPVSLILHVLAWRRASGSNSDTSLAVIPAPGFQHLLDCVFNMAKHLEGEDLRAACTAAAASGAGGGNDVACSNGDVDGVAAVMAALSDAAFSIVDPVLHHRIIKLCVQMLHTFACDRRAPARDLRRLVAFLVRDVHGSLFSSFGGGAQYESMCRTTAALGAFNGVTLACCKGGRGATFASDLYGQAASQAVMALGVTLNGAPASHAPSRALHEARMVEAAADVLCLLLQADATAIAAALDHSHASSQNICRGVAEVFYNPFDNVRIGLPLTACSANEAGAPAAAFCEEALNQLDSYCCTPAAYMAVVGCPHPAVALALILAVGHCAELEDPASGTDDPQLSLMSSGSCQGRHIQRAPSAASSSVSFLAATQWPVRPRLEGPNDCAVPVRQCAALVLRQLRQAAVIHLQNVAREANVLGIAADRLPKVDELPPQQSQAAAAITVQVDGAALAALLRLVCGPNAELSAAAEDALVSHYLLPERVSEARAEAAELGDWGGPLQLALREGWLLPSQNHELVVLKTCGTVIEDLATITPVNKLMCSGRLAPTLTCIKAVLYACTGHQRLDSDAWTLAHCTWALLVRILEHGLAAFRDRPDCRSGLSPLVALLPICWFYLLQVVPEGRGPTPRLMRAWLPAALRWVPTLAEISGGPNGTCAALVSSLDSMLVTLRDNGPLAQDVLMVAREMLSPCHQAIDGELRLRLTELFPELSAATDDPAVKRAPGHPPRDLGSGKGSSYDVVDLTLSDEDEAEAEEEEDDDFDLMNANIEEALQGLEWEIEGIAALGSPEDKAARLADALTGDQHADKAHKEEDGSRAGQANQQPSESTEPSPTARRTASVAAAMKAAAALQRGGIMPGSSNTNNPFAVPSRCPTEVETEPNVSSIVPPATTASSALTHLPVTTSTKAPGGPTSGSKAPLSKEEWFQTIKALKSAVLETAKAARTAGGKPSTRVGDVDLPQAYRFINKFKQAISAPAGGPTRSKPRSTISSRRERFKELLGQADGEAGRRNRGGSGGGGSGSGSGGGGGVRSKGWAIGGGSCSRGGSTTAAMPAPDPLLQQPLPTLRARLQQQRAAEAAKDGPAAAAATEAANKVGSGGGSSGGAVAAPGVMVIDEEDFLGEVFPGGSEKQSGAAGGPQKRLGLGLMAAVGRTTVTRARGVVLLETAGPRGLGNPAKAIPKFEVTLRMDDVVRDVLQLPMSALLPDLNSGVRRNPALTHGGGVEPPVVPFRFNSLEHYTNTFRTLLMEELAASVRSSVEELAGGGGPSTASALVSVEAAVESIARTDDLLSIKFRMANSGPTCRTDDLIIITSRPLANATALAQPPRPYVLAAVREVTPEAGVWIARVQVYINQTSGGIHTMMMPQTRWHLTVLYSLVTNFREFTALCNLYLVYAPVVQYLLKPEPGAISTSAAAGASWDAASLPPPLKAGLAGAFNESQRKAILSSLDASFFTLVQGPPGTGKTSAIMGIISVLLARRDITDYKGALARGASTRYDSQSNGAASRPSGLAATAAAGSGREGKLSAGMKRGITRNDKLAGAAPAGPLKKSSAAKRFEAEMAAKAAAASAAKMAGSGLAATGSRDLCIAPPSKQQRLPASVDTASPAPVSELRGREDTSGSVVARASSAPLGAARSAVPKAPQEVLDAFDFTTEPRCRILVCAQSNAAIDELLARLASEGVWRADGRRKPPAVVRLGRVETVHMSVHALHVDSLASALIGQNQAMVQADASIQNTTREISDAIKQHGEVKIELTQMRRKLAERELQDQQQPSKRARAGSDGGGAQGENDAGDVDGHDCGEGLGPDDVYKGSWGSGTEIDEGEGGERHGHTCENTGGSGGGGNGAEDVNEMKTRLIALEQQELQLFNTIKSGERMQSSKCKDIERQKKVFRKTVVKAAEVVVTTLSSAGGDLVFLWSSTGTVTSGSGGGGARCGILPSDAPRFDALIIDEAAQALEPAALIPLQLLKPGAKVVLVGDPQQLPPTVRSRAAAAARLSQSLFERLQSAGCNVCMLSRQYRMHPDISRFPSTYFYNSALLDGETITATSRSAPCHAHPLLGPLVVYNCAGEMESRRGGSLVNKMEAKLVAELYKGLLRHFPDYRPQVAILTPYRAQLTALQRALGDAGVGKEAMAGIDIATVDSYQGREADIVIFSTVRTKLQTAGAGAGVGFLNDVRRMNVALTRARRCLWVVGHALTLADSPPWLALLRHAATHGSLMSPVRSMRDLLTSSPDEVVQSCRVSEVRLNQILAGAPIACGSDGGGSGTGHNDRSPDRPPRHPLTLVQKLQPKAQAAPLVVIGTNVAGGGSPGPAAPAGGFGVPGLTSGSRCRKPEPGHADQSRGADAYGDGSSALQQRPEARPKVLDGRDALARTAAASKAVSKGIHVRPCSGLPRSGAGKRSAEWTAGGDPCSTADVPMDHPSKRLAIEGSNGAQTRAEAATTSGEEAQGPAKVGSTVAYSKVRMTTGIQIKSAHQTASLSAPALTASTRGPPAPCPPDAKHVALAASDGAATLDGRDGGADTRVRTNPSPSFVGIAGGIQVTAHQVGCGAARKPNPSQRYPAPGTERAATFDEGGTLVLHARPPKLSAGTTSAAAPPGAALSPRPRLPPNPGQEPQASDASGRNRPSQFRAKDGCSGDSKQDTDQTSEMPSDRRNDHPLQLPSGAASSREHGPIARCSQNRDRDHNHGAGESRDHVGDRQGFRDYDRYMTGDREHGWERREKGDPPRERNRDRDKECARGQCRERQPERERERQEVRPKEWHREYDQDRYTSRKRDLSPGHKHGRNPVRDRDKSEKGRDQDVPGRARARTEPEGGSRHEVPHGQSCGEGSAMGRAMQPT